MSYPTSKKCNTCNFDLPLEDFHFAKKNKITGRGGRCRKCESERAKKYYQKNKDLILLKEKTRSTTEKFQTRVKTYRKKYRNKAREAEKRYRERTPTSPNTSLNLYKNEQIHK